MKQMIFFLLLLLKKIYDLCKVRQDSIIKKIKWHDMTWIGKYQCFFKYQFIFRFQAIFNQTL